MESLGKIAYEAYCKARNWKSVRGEQLPHFEQQSAELKDAWEAAAQTLVEKIDLDNSTG